VTAKPSDKNGPEAAPILLLHPGHSVQVNCYSNVSTSGLRFDSGQRL
jgi:hypothetical protein